MSGVGRCFFLWLFQAAAISLICSGCSQLDDDLISDLDNAPVPYSSNSVTDEERKQLAKGCDYRILFIGNSHSAPIPDFLRPLIGAGVDGSKVYCEVVPGFGFLEDHWQTENTQRIFDSLKWTHVVLQAQKYSTSGKYNYSTDAAKRFIEKAEKIGALPIMYPEWRQRGNPNEAERVQKLHTEIAAGTTARVAPVGMAWDKVLAALPELELYAFDGNHAAEMGNYVTACTLFATLAGKTPEGLPFVGNRAPADDQLRQIQQCCWQALEEFPPSASTPEGD